MTVVRAASAKCLLLLHLLALLVLLALLSMWALLLSNCVPTAKDLAESRGSHGSTAHLTHQVVVVPLAGADAGFVPPLRVFAPLQQASTKPYSSL